MNKCNKKRIVNLLSVLCIIALCAVFMGAAPAHTPDFYVNDYADILSEEAEKKILNAGVSLCNETTAQVAVLTIESLEGEDIFDYSVEVFREWGIGDKEKENGVLIVFSLEDREMWITVGHGLEGTLTDIRTGQIRDTYATPHYKEDRFEEGTLELYFAIVNYIRTEEYGLEPLAGYEDMAEQIDRSGQVDPISALKVILIPVILLAVISISQHIKYARLLAYDKKHGTHLAREYKEEVMGIKHLLLMLWASGIFRSGRGGFGGGGFGGGGFGGGGGGGYSGGGGSTGGGGAGGSF